MFGSFRISTSSSVQCPCLEAVVPGGTNTKLTSGTIEKLHGITNVGRTYQMHPQWLYLDAFFGCPREPSQASLSVDP